MSLLAPWFLIIASCAACAAIVWHFISWQLRTPVPFPTLRFVPHQEMAAKELKKRLSDIKLLLLRIAILMLLGLSLAQPVLHQGKEGRIVLIDVSPFTLQDDDWRTQVDSLVEGADKVILFADKTYTTTVDSWKSTLEQLPPAKQAAGSISNALAYTISQSTNLQHSFKSIKLQIISPFPAESIDAATLELRQFWQGEIEAHRVKAVEKTEMIEAMAAQTVRLEWLQESATHRQDPWQSISKPETVNGIYSPAGVLISNFERKAIINPDITSDYTVIATWLDGQPAAVEKLVNGVRHTYLGFAIPELGDIALRPSFKRFNNWLNDPLRLTKGTALMSDSQLARVLPLRLSNKEVQPTNLNNIQITPIMPWLLLLTLFLVIAEPVLRKYLADKRTFKDSEARL